MVASVLAIDVKGFFDKVNHQRMAHVLWEMGFPLSIVKWVQSFLADRQAALRLDDQLDPMQPIDFGIPQGSPCSPVLSIIYGAEPLQRILKDENLKTTTNIPLSPYSYIDDIVLAAFSNSLSDNVETLNKGLMAVIEELKKISMEIDPDKLEIQHFSRRPGDPSPHLEAMVNGKLVKVVPSKAMRWLGIFFDCKLSFNEHVKIMSARASSVINDLRVLANTIRGLSQYNLRTLFKTCVLTIMTYASAIWFQPEKRQKNLISMLEITQNKALRHICGAFRTTPCHTLRILAHIPPIELTLRRFSVNAAARLSKLSLHAPIIQRLPNIFRERHRPSSASPTPFSTPHRTPENKGGGSVGWNSEKFGHGNWGSEKKVRTQTDIPWGGGNSFGQRGKIENFAWPSLYSVSTYVVLSKSNTRTVWCLGTMCGNVMHVSRLLPPLRGTVQLLDG